MATRDRSQYRCRQCPHKPLLSDCSLHRQGNRSKLQSTTSTSNLTPTSLVAPANITPVHPTPTLPSGVSPGTSANGAQASRPADVAVPPATSANVVQATRPADIPAPAALSSQSFLTQTGQSPSTPAISSNASAFSFPPEPHQSNGYYGHLPTTTATAGTSLQMLLQAGLHPSALAMFLPFLQNANMPVTTPANQSSALPQGPQSSALSLQAPPQPPLSPLFGSADPLPHVSQTMTEEPDPLMLLDSMPPPSTPPAVPPTSSVSSHSDTDASEAEDDASDHDSDENHTGKAKRQRTDKATGKAPVKAKRVRPSRARPIYGMVEGAMTGMSEYPIPRTQPLRPLEEKAEKASRRFHREIAFIISRCERLCRETGAWMVLGIQHTHATGPPITYTSLRMRKDAEQESKSLVAQFHRLMQIIKKARFHEAKSEATKIHDSEERAALAKQQVEKQALEFQRRFARQAAELAAKDALIQQYRQGLNVD